LLPLRSVHYVAANRHAALMMTVIILIFNVCSSIGCDRTRTAGFTVSIPYLTCGSTGPLRVIISGASPADEIIEVCILLRQLRMIVLSENPPPKGRLCMYLYSAKFNRTDPESTPCQSFADVVNYCFSKGAGKKFSSRGPSSAHSTCATLGGEQHCPEHTDCAGPPLTDFF
jgi:hypothetical protein